MRYFYDTEFIEDGKTIDLISIGVISEDDRSYYAISTEFNPRKADQWVKDNVLVHLPERRVNLSDLSVSPRLKGKSLLWKSRKRIAADLIAFFKNGANTQEDFELWAYYGDYDHVALCQLFGRMIDLPEGFPKLTYDLRQWLNHWGKRDTKQPDDAPNNALEDARWVRETFLRVNHNSVL